MADKNEALYQFWSRFGWTAFDENTVPDNALENNNNKYITYQDATDSFGSEMMLTASLWMRSNSWTGVDKMSEKIARYIEIEMPPAIPIDGGWMRIRKGSPFSTRTGDDNDTLRRRILNVIVEFFTQY